MSSSDRITPDGPTTDAPAPNRATRRAAGQRARRIGAVGSGAILATGAAAAVLGMTAAPAGAAGLVVDDSGDGPANATDCTTPVPGACSLRDAIAAANDGDVITFDASITGITLTDGQLEGTGESITITGPGASALTITADADSRVFYGRGNGTVTISGVTLTGGHPLYDGNNHRTGEGGAILFYCDGGSASLVLDHVVITENFSGDEQNGGGIAFDGCGDLTVNNSQIDHNTAYYAGGGVSFVASNNFTMNTSTVHHNETTYYGGGIYLDDNGSGQARIQSSTISTNKAVGNDGGGIVVDDTNTLIHSSTISGNTAGDDGGGLYVTQGSDYTLAVVNSTITGNTAASNGGGIAVAYGGIDLQQTTISGNTAGGFGDGLYLTGPRGLSTRESEGAARAANHPGKHKDAETAKVGAQALGTVTVTGTIISGNADNTDDIGTRSTAALTASGSLFGTVAPGVTVTDTGGTRSGITNPGLGALANNGGPTQTMALLAGSPALNQGPTSVASVVGEFDQRGPGYPRVVNGRVDVGAYEAQAIMKAVDFTG